MPLYEYKCRKCRRVFEVLERMDGKGSSLKCPDCGHTHLEKQISLPAKAIMKSDSKPFLGTNTCCGLTDPCADPKKCCGR